MNKILCEICKEEIIESNRMVAFAEATGTWYDSGTHDALVDDIQPISHGWFLAHYECFYQKPKK